MDSLKQETRDVHRDLNLKQTRNARTEQVTFTWFSQKHLQHPGIVDCCPHAKEECENEQVDLNSFFANSVTAISTYKSLNASTTCL